MLYRALKSFVGVVRMNKGDVKEIDDKKAIEDLLKLGYIEPVEDSKPAKTQDKKSKTKKEVVDNA